jgi:ubiquitin-conjugating enzyme E2 S
VLVAVKLFELLHLVKCRRLPIFSFYRGDHFHLLFPDGAASDLYQSIPYTAMRHLLKELWTSPLEGIHVQLNEESVLDIVGIIEGPGESTSGYLVQMLRVDACFTIPGGYFRVKFEFTEGWFATRIFHLTVSSAGEICVNTLKKDWKLSYGIGHILVTIKCLLIYLNPDSAPDKEACKVLQENSESYCERTKLITSVHATPKARSMVHIDSED